MAAGPVYEVNLSIDPDIIEAFDEWLAYHVDEMLALAGFTRAETFELEDDDNGRARRVTHYHLESQGDLDDYLAGPAATMRQSGVDRFGDKFSATRRILLPGDAPGEPPPATQIDCLNCGRHLAGQYCANCGQRARSRFISLWELITDAFGDLFEIDSRLWRTLIPLLVRPGKLTSDYLQGRRARFMPPFRTYLVLSVLFFFIALFDPREEFGILFEPDQPSEEEAVPTDGQDSKTAEDIQQEVIDELKREGIIVDSGKSPEDMPARDSSSSSTEESAVDPDAEPEQVDEEGSSTPELKITFDDDETNCEFDAEDTSGMPAWLARRLTPERLDAVCRKIEADRGKSLVEKLVDNIPAALFVLLPLMAFVLKLLYPLSKRYYVEHLLFVIHFHAFVFLALTLIMLLTGGATRLGVSETLGPVVITAASIYIPVYLYKSMRRVYNQGHLATLPKYLLLVVAYFSGALTLSVVTVMLAAFAI